MSEDPETRSRIMRAVKSGDTVPELVVRSLAHRMGYRFRLHRKDLPGKPDLVFPGKRKVIFVHGCFWHGHDCVRGDRMPKENRAYWIEKIERNRSRDESTIAKLRNSRWDVRVFWECTLKDRAALTHQLRQFLETPADD